MNNEIMLRYLYYLTHMNSGTKEWQSCYDAWRKFAEFIGHEKYEECLKSLAKFNKKYRSKK